MFSKAAMLGLAGLAVAFVARGLQAQERERPASPPAATKTAGVRDQGFNYMHETWTNPWSPKEGLVPVLPKTSQQRQADFRLMLRAGATAVRIHGANNGTVRDAVREAQSAKGDGDTGLRVWLSYRPNMRDLGVGQEFGDPPRHPANPGDLDGPYRDENGFTPAGKKLVSDLRREFLRQFEAFVKETAALLRKGDVLVVANELPFDLGYDTDNAEFLSEQALLEALLRIARTNLPDIELTFACLPLSWNKEKIQDWPALKKAGLDVVSVNCYWSSDRLDAVLSELNKKSNLTVAVTETGALTCQDAKTRGGDGRGVGVTALEGPKGHLAGEESQATGVADVCNQLKGMPLRGFFLFAWDEPSDSVFGLVRTNLAPCNWSTGLGNGVYKEYPDGGSWDHGCVLRSWCYVPVGKPAMEAAARSFRGTTAVGRFLLTKAVLKAEPPSPSVQIWWNAGGAAPSMGPPKDLDPLAAQKDRNNPYSSILLYQLKTATSDPSTEDDGKVVWAKAADGLASSFLCLDESRNYWVRACWNDGKMSEWTQLLPEANASLGREYDSNTNVLTVTLRPAKAGYEIVDLGKSIGTTVSGRIPLLNNSGQVLLFADKQHAIWQAGKVTPVQRVRGFSPCGLNDAGALCGAGDGPRVQAKFDGRTYFTYSHLAYTLAPATDGAKLLDAAGRNWALTRDINNRGDTVGTYGHYADPRKPWPLAHTAVLWSGGKATDLSPVEGDYSEATLINDAGQIAGIVSKGQARRGFFRDKGKPADLGDLGGKHVVPTEINARGQVVGWAHNKQNTLRAFTWQAGKMTELAGSHAASRPDDPDGGETHAWGVNDDGCIVGDCRPTKANASRAVMWSNQVMTDLNSVAGENLGGWTLILASSINNAGQIVGIGMLNGEPHYFLATPSSPPAAAKATR